MERRTHLTTAETAAWATEATALGQLAAGDTVLLQAWQGADRWRLVTVREVGLEGEDTLVRMSDRTDVSGSATRSMLDRVLTGAGR